MSRPFPPTVGSLSPWGAIDCVTPLGPEAFAVTTASHGGLCISDEALVRMPPAVRCTDFSAGGWFEEDCDWALPYLALGLDAFEPNAAVASERWTAAVRTVQKFHPQHVALLDADVEAGSRRHG